MGWVLRLVETGVEGLGRSVDVMAIDCPGDLGDIADLGLTLAQGKQLVALVQQEIVAAQSRDHAAQRPMCRSCGAACQIKDYRPHQIATLFGQVVLRLPRFRCAGCGEPIAGTPFRVTLLDIVAPEAPPSWAVGARLNPGPHQFHAPPDHFRAWARRRGHLFCRLSDVRELMRPVPIPGDAERWGVCDGRHREAHEFVPA